MNCGTKWRDVSCNSIFGYSSPCDCSCCPPEVTTLRCTISADISWMTSCMLPDSTGSDDVVKIASTIVWRGDSRGHNVGGSFTYYSYRFRFHYSCTILGRCSRLVPPNSHRLRNYVAQPVWHLTLNLILSNATHVPNNLLPPSSAVCEHYNLRRHRHNLELPKAAFTPEQHVARTSNMLLATSKQHVARQHVACCRQHVACISATCIPLYMRMRRSYVTLLTEGTVQYSSFN